MPDEESVGLVERIIPASYLHDKGLLQDLRKWFLLALVIRFVFMPFTCHADMISSYHRSYRLTQQLTMLYLNPHEVIQSLFLMLYTPILPLRELLYWEGSITVSPEFWMTVFASHESVYLALFLFKVPYLLFDLMTAVLFLHMFKEKPRTGVLAFSTWLLNPITIFTFYIYARHEAIAIFFIVYALFFMEKDRPYASILCLGVALWSRYYPILYLPFFFILLNASRMKKLKMLGVSLLPILLGICAKEMAGHSRQLHLAGLLKGSFGGYILMPSLQSSWIQEIYLFPLIYALLVLYAYNYENESGVFVFIRYCLVTTLAFYSLSLFHPQFFSWFIPFLVLTYASTSENRLKGMHTIQTVLFLVYLCYWGAHTTTHLFAPLNPDYVTSMGSPTDVIDRFFPWLTFVNISRSFMSAVCIFMAGHVLFRMRACKEAFQEGEIR